MNDNNNSKNTSNNLISLGDRTTEEQRSIARMGGKASGEARRKKRAIHDAVIQALSTPMSEEWKSAMEANHLEGLLKNMDDDMQTALIASLVGEVLQNGNVKAAELLVALAGEKPIDKVQQEVVVSKSPIDDLTAELFEGEDNVKT